MPVGEALELPEVVRVVAAHTGHQQLPDTNVVKAKVVASLRPHGLRTTVVVDVLQLATALKLEPTPKDESGGA